MEAKKIFIEITAAAENGDSDAIKAQKRMERLSGGDLFDFELGLKTAYQLNALDGDERRGRDKIIEQCWRQKLAVDFPDSMGSTRKGKAWAVVMEDLRNAGVELYPNDYCGRFFAFPPRDSEAPYRDLYLGIMWQLRSYISIEDRGSRFFVITERGLNDSCYAETLDLENESELEQYREVKKSIFDMAIKIKPKHLALFWGVQRAETYDASRIVSLEAPLDSLKISPDDGEQLETQMTCVLERVSTLKVRMLTIAHKHAEKATPQNWLMLDFAKFATLRVLVLSGIRLCSLPHSIKCIICERR